MESRYVTDCDCYLSPIQAVEGAYVPTEADIFGAASVVVESRPSETQSVRFVSEKMTESIAYHGVVLIVFILLAYLIHSYRSSLVLAFKVQAGRMSEGKVYDEQSLIFKKFLTRSWWFCVLLISGLLVRVGTWFQAESWLPDAIVLRSDLLVLGVIAMVSAIAVYRWGVMKIVGKIIRNESFFNMLRFSNSIISIASCLVLAPFFLIVGLSDNAAIDNILYATIILAVGLYMLYLTKSYRFFAARNVSILQWILYLCTVEFFPISFFVLVFIRE